ncbi:hypothetical protein ACFQ0G_47585 [Streptomyces chiangmaiensis]
MKPPLAAERGCVDAPARSLRPGLGSMVNLSVPRTEETRGLADADFLT